MSRTFKEISKVEWRPTKAGSEEEDISWEAIKTGCLQRIADATEVMAQNYVKLQNDLDFYKRMTTERGKRIDSLEKSNSALKGHITRLKNNK